MRRTCACPWGLRAHKWGRGQVISWDGRQTRIALAALNLRQMRRHAYHGRQVLQRQTTLIALAAQEGGDQGFHGESVAHGRGNGSYDRMNSYGSAIFFAMLSVLGVGMTHLGAVWGRSQVRMRGAMEKWTITRNGTH